MREVHHPRAPADHEPDRSAAHMKCKAKREASGEVRVNDKGTRMAKAVCPECGTNLNRILGKA